MTPHEAAIRRFETGYTTNEAGCWIWNRGTFENGYGRIYDDGKTRKAHRFSWELNKGRIPKAMNVLHSCDVRACVNPAHLWIGTDKENAEDRNRKGRQCHGPRHKSYKIKPEDVPVIRAMRERGLKLDKIADAFGVSRPRIWQILNGIKIKHLVPQSD